MRAQPCDSQLPRSVGNSYTRAGVTRMVDRKSNELVELVSSLLDAVRLASGRAATWLFEHRPGVGGGEASLDRRNGAGGVGYMISQAGAFHFHGHMSCNRMTTALKTEKNADPWTRNVTITRKLDPPLPTAPTVRRPRCRAASIP